MTDKQNRAQASEPAAEAALEMELTDADILDAMQHIPGYLDISTEDFRTIYHLSHRHATERLFGNTRAENLMRTGITPLQPEMTLDAAAVALVAAGSRALPVVDAGGCVTGILTENDFLRQLEVASLPALLLAMQENTSDLNPRLHAITVRQAMTVPVVTIGRQAGFMQIIGAFHQHAGRSLPVVDEGGRFLGMLLRKDFLHTYHLENLL